MNSRFSHLPLKYVDIILFCIVFALSFVFRSQIIRSVDAVTATFVTYGVSVIFFLLVNIRNIGGITRLFEHKWLLLVINISTLINNLFAFVIFKYISPISYVMVFFSGLAFFGVMKNPRTAPIQVLLINCVTLILSLLIGFLTADADLDDTLIGLGLSLFSAVFGAIYIHATALLHENAGATSTQILLLRFPLLLLLTAPFALYDIGQHGMAIDDFWMLLIIALTTCIIPLFLMQKSIRQIGARITSQFTSLTPILCMVFMMLIDDKHFTALQGILIAMVTVSMVIQAKLNFPKEL